MGLVRGGSQQGSRATDPTEMSPAVSSVDCLVCACLNPWGLKACADWTVYATPRRLELPFKTETMNE